MYSLLAGANQVDGLTRLRAASTESSTQREWEDPAYQPVRRNHSSIFPDHTTSTAWHRYKIRVVRLSLPANFRKAPLGSFVDEHRRRACVCCQNRQRHSSNL